jgi:uncharacterized protein YjbI with pentapeptide repeats
MVRVTEEADMATKNVVNVQHEPIQLLPELETKRVFSNESAGLASEAFVAQAETVSAPSKAEGVKRDRYLTRMPIPQVVRRMRSSDHRIVLQAVEALRARGCLSDGTLSWVCLQYANLQSANLSASNLRSADLHKANLEMADLSYANLNGARLTRASMLLVNLHKASLDGANLVGANLQGAKNVSEEQLSRVSRMRGAILPDGNLYDGRFNLPGDFGDASILHIDFNDPAAIASFYGVSLEDLLHGQEWRQAHMPFISAWHESAGFRNAELIMNWF